MAERTIPEIILPTERTKAESYNPRFIILYGFPKSGKSSCIASLDDNLVIDLDDGYRALSVMKLKANTIKDVFAIKNAIEAKIKETGQKPYRIITIDSATKLEELCLPYAAALYRKTSMGSDFGLLRDKDRNIRKDKNGNPMYDPKADVRTLPKGAGYLYTRQALKEVLHMFKPLCQTLILVCHVKDRQIQLNGTESTSLMVDLAGKLSDIICGESDAVGYIYRSGNKTMLSFDGGDNLVREARPLHLRGRIFTVGESDEQNNVKFNLNQIFIDE